MDFVSSTAERDTRRGAGDVTEAVFALGRAAELAFAIEDLRKGLEICREIPEATRPNTPMQQAFYALVTSVAGAADVQLDGSGVLVLHQGRKAFQYKWPIDDSALAVVMLRSFFPAAAISTPFPMMLASLSQIVIKPQAIAAFQISPEFRALLIQSERHFYGMSAIESMEEDYAARLLSMRKDVAHWEMLQPKSPLIDWPLLCLWVAILRSNRGMELPAPRNDAAEFIRWLARELARREP